MTRRFFKLAKWTGIATIYYILWIYVIYHTAEKTLSGNPPGDMPVIVLLIGLSLAGLGWRWRSARQNHS